MSVVDHGAAEDFKAHYHAALGVLVAVAAVYNACAFVRRPARHLALNTLLYSAGTAYEVAQTLRHLRSHYGE